MSGKRELSMQLCPGNDRHAFMRFASHVFFFSHSRRCSAVRHGDAKIKARVLSGAITRLRLLRKFIRRLGCALRQLTAWQSPRALFTKRQREEFSKGQLVFLAIRSHADGNGVLRHVTT
jgi:hypothetical protein